MPCVLCYVVVGDFGVDRSNGWKALFLEEKHYLKNIDHLYLMASQLKQKLKQAKKS